MEAKFYTDALRRLSLDRDVRQITEEIATNETQHAQALKKSVADLGGRPSPPPEVDFGDALRSQDAYLALAQTFEDTGVSAYNGAGPLLESKKVLAAAGTIVQVEGRHAGLIRMLRDQRPAPNAFDDVLSIDQVRTRADPYIVG